jgi:hypothetical protein
MNTPPEENRKKQIAAVAVLILGIGGLASATLFGWRLVPGVFGEWLGTVIGVMTTPFLLEASFALIGLCLVVALNHRRWLRDGDEWVQLDVADEPAALPDHDASPSATHHPAAKSDPRDRG